MKKLRLSFAALLAAVASIAWSVAFAFDNQKLDADTSTLVNPSGLNLLGNDVTADTGMPPPLINFSAEKASQVGSLQASDSIHRVFPGAIPPLITADRKIGNLSDSTRALVDDIGTPTEIITVACDLGLPTEIITVTDTSQFQGQSGLGINRDTGAVPPLIGPGIV